LSYLLVVDEASRYIWVFLTKSKEPPLDIIDTFYDCFGYRNGGSICSDQGGEFAGSFAFSDLLLRKHKYVIEPTGVDNSSQNGAVEIYNAKLDHHDFKGVFLGYTATDQNIIYLDLDSGVVKSSHHTQFDEAWYLQSTRLPAAQLLYDL
jgi:hypothetical protein